MRSMAVAKNWWFNEGLEVYGEFIYKMYAYTATRNEEI